MPQKQDGVADVHGPVDVHVTAFEFCTFGKAVDHVRRCGLLYPRSLIEREILPPVSIQIATVLGFELLPWNLPPDPEALAPELRERSSVAKKPV